MLLDVIDSLLDAFGPLKYICDLPKKAANRGWHSNMIHFRMPKPTSFIPVFNPTVTIAFWRFSLQVNPVFCLMPPSADILVAILADLQPKIVLKEPQLNDQRWHYSQTVPWLEFPDGTLVNAGQEADYWRQRPNDAGELVSPDFAVAERNCRQDIAAAQELTKQFGFDIQV